MYQMFGIRIRMRAAPKNTSVVLGPELQDFIADQIEDGSYRSASEVVREALQRFAIEQRKEEALLVALDEGLGSGRAAPGVFDRVRGRRARRARPAR